MPYYADTLFVNTVFSMKAVVMDAMHVTSSFPHVIANNRSLASSKLHTWACEESQKHGLL